MKFCANKPLDYDYLRTLTEIACNQMLQDDVERIFKAKTGKWPFPAHVVQQWIEVIAANLFTDKPYAEIGLELSNAISFSESDIELLESLIILSGRWVRAIESLDISTSTRDVLLESYSVDITREIKCTLDNRNHLKPVESLDTNETQGENRKLAAQDELRKLSAQIKELADISKKTGEPIFTAQQGGDETIKFLIKQVQNLTEAVGDLSRKVQDSTPWRAEPQPPMLNRPVMSRAEMAAEHKKMLEEADMAKQFQEALGANPSAAQVEEHRQQTIEMMNDAVAMHQAIHGNVSPMINKSDVMGSIAREMPKQHQPVTLKFEKDAVQRLAKGLAVFIPMPGFDCIMYRSKKETRPIDEIWTGTSAQLFRDYLNQIPTPSTFAIPGKEHWQRLRDELIQGYQQSRVAQICDPDKPKPPEVVAGRADVLGRPLTEFTGQYGEVDSKWDFLKDANLVEKILTDSAAERVQEEEAAARHAAASPDRKWWETVISKEVRKTYVTVCRVSDFNDRNIIHFGFYFGYEGSSGLFDSYVSNTTTDTVAEFARKLYWEMSKQLEDGMTLVFKAMPIIPATKPDWKYPKLLDAFWGSHP